MADANSKPVAGASEPHELEEMARLELERIFAPAIDARAPYAKFMFAAGVSAVLALVRQEQENDASDVVTTAARRDLESWDRRYDSYGTIAHNAWFEMIRAWWLSHTAVAAAPERGPAAPQEK